MRSVHEFEDILQGIIVNVLDWQNTPNNVRIGWQVEGAPGFKITDEMIFITATSVDGDYNKQYDVIYEQGSPDYVIYRGGTRIMDLSVVAYGYESLSNLYKIIIGMRSDRARHSLNLEKIYYVPITSAPRRMPELFQAQWWERADMTLRFYEAIAFEEPVQTVESVEVEVHNKGGLLAEFTVE